MTTEIASAVILIVFTTLLLIGAVSTLGRHLRYRRLKIRPPLLLYRDRDLLVGLSIPFALISAARAFSWTAVRNVDGSPAMWWLLVTGLPPIYALARYCYFELFVIERPPRSRRTG